MGEGELKLYLVVREDIEAPVGKFITHGGHAADFCLETCREKDPERYAEYMACPGRPKITVRAKNLAAMEKLAAKAEELGIPVRIITDSARTVFDEPTVMIMGIGPVRPEEHHLVKRLRLY